MSQAVPQGRTPDGVIARAIRAVHDQFEDALVAEWNVRADSAAIRNASQALPNRCRQCKKAAAGTGGDICACKTRTGLERCLSNPRDTLLSLLRQRCQNFSASASLAKFVEQITSIGVADGRDLDWIESQIQGLRPSLSRVCRKWIIGVCPAPFRDTGQLPAWWKVNEVILDSEFRRSLSSDDSEAELDLIDAQIVQHSFHEAKKAALDRASIHVNRVVLRGLRS